MGFMRAFGKILAGKPIYEPQGPGGPLPAQQLPPAHAPGRKTIPVVRIGRLENHADSHRLDIYAEILNESSELIFLDKIILCGATRELDNELRPGEKRRFLIYSGPLLVNEPRGYAEVRYRKQADGDYFADYHEIHCHYSGGPQGYAVTDLRLRGPVRDI